MAKRCESCGMPLKNDPQGGGSEADGSKSTTYCSICYANGTFVQQGVTAAEFQANCLTALHDKGMPKIMAWAFTRGIPNLPRWAEGRG
ncbi:zinc ribbon domain-containing protein [Yoonia sp. R2331]|uniref:zinc ribbon domain-containing protein n=1 Tax=Yoonia sp. R2331 TaxID=3237238 RepID=UPI0034E5E614